MNVKVIFFILFSASLTIYGYGQAKNQSPGEESSSVNLSVSDSLEQHTLLWEVSGNGLRQPSYLFGTMHLLCNDEAVISPGLQAAIDSARTVYFEIDMDNLGEMLGALRYSRMSGGKTLRDLLSAEDYRKVEDYFKAHSSPIPLPMLEHFKPMFVSALVGEQLMDCPQKAGMEQVIMKEAKSQGREIRGLETAQFQAGLFDSIPYESQAKELVNYIDSVDYYRQNSLEMAEVYHRQDLVKLDSLVARSDPAMDKYMDLLLYGRNRHWVELLPGIMEQGPVLIAVGAGHLVGQKGLISLLRQKGYRLRPLLNKW